MSKKKNRKKELKKQQRLDIRFLKQEEADLFENFQQPVVIADRRTIPYYDDQKTAFYQELERTGELPDCVLLNQQLKEGTFPFTEDYVLFRKAMHTPNDGAREKLLRRVLAINPDFFAARFHLLLIEEVPFERSYFDKVYNFYQEALVLWKAGHYLDWYSFETRPVLQGLMYCLEYFKEEGFYGLALEIVDSFRLHGMQTFPPNFLPLMFSLYNQLGQYDKVEEAYFAEAHKGKKNDVALLHLLISKALQGKWTEADKLFRQLEKLNPATTFFFASDDWLDRVLEIEGKEWYIPLSEGALQTALYPMFDFLNEHVMLQNYLTRPSDEVDDFIEAYSNRTILELQQVLSRMETWYANLSKPEFTGIRMDIVRILSEQKLNAAADFKKKTEKELLAIKGIGPGTVKKLKENGVVFKNGN